MKLSFQSLVFFSILGISLPNADVSANTIIGEYHFKDCDTPTSEGLARHCLHYNITVLADHNSKTVAVISAEGHQTSWRMVANTEKSKRGLLLKFSRYESIDSGQTYKKGDMLGSLDFDKDFKVILRPSNLQTLTGTKVLYNRPSENQGIFAE